MRKSVVLLPMDIRYATLSLTPCTSRNWRFSAPGTTAAFQVAPPSVVTTYVPPVPAAHTTRELTGLTEISSCVVPLCCGVRVGWCMVWFDCAIARVREPVSKRMVTRGFNMGDLRKQEEGRVEQYRNR